VCRQICVQTSLPGSVSNLGRGLRDPDQRRALSDTGASDVA